MEPLKRKRKTPIQPRWYNQAYLLFLALRQHSQDSLPRTELIEAAIELDKKIGVELQLPRVFRGKTPKNSASATLTNNSDRYFVAYKPEGSKSTHFKLAYTPGNVDDAVTEYQNWFKKLIDHDWPFCFGVPKSIDESHYHTPVSHVDELESMDKELVDLKLIDEETNKLKAYTEPSPPTTTKQKEPEPLITLDQLDLTNIPQSWHDIVQVKPSLIPFGGNGLFAKRKLPYNTPIGFYFGVPMTEDEFDSLKDRVGRSSEYSIMYRRTVLDATDDQGQPVTDPTNPRYCPFHFMNETSSQKAASIAFVEGAVVNQIICWTKKEIEKDEELLVWYGKDVHRYWTKEEEEAQQKQQQQQQQQQQQKRKNCKKKDKKSSTTTTKSNNNNNNNNTSSSSSNSSNSNSSDILAKDEFVIIDESSAYFSPTQLQIQRDAQPLNQITLVNYTKEQVEKW
ncbi:hypothetical protein EDC94DRAFT_597942 [Helicostylum pulchrum]|nr:hypothetical protein EDC94DRAFT_597942 [Helicostylum pulchrum]